MTSLKKKLYRLTFMFLWTALPTISFAQVKIINPLKNSTTIPELIKKVLEGVVKIGMPVIVLAVIYCGFLFVKAQGKPDEISKAKSALGWTLVGAAILLGSWGLAQLISETVQAL